MNRIYSLIGISLLAIGIFVIIVKFSVFFGVSEKREIQKKNTIHSSILRIPTTEDDLSKVEVIPFEDESITPPKNTPILAEFGRLGSFLYLSNDSKEKAIEERGSTGIILGSTPGIISLYDLFAEYTLYDRAGDFRINQVTNGSFYISREKDEKISIYAIDGVVRLSFLYEDEEMTSMMLFPGSYLRFDPKKNRSLKNADLFRTILSLQVDNNEVFEFVNPRVNRGGDDEDIFLNYRLNPDSKKIFRAVSLLFRKKVENLDMRKNYTSCYQGGETTESTLLLNPSKKDHSLLVELSNLLSCALQPNAGTELVKRIGKVYTDTKDLRMSHSSAKSVVEQFLLDGRFALYGGVANSAYQDIYDSIAEIIGIKPTTGKSRLFQTLADIYSRNLFTQKRTSNRIKIDTYGPTAIELEKTLMKYDQNAEACSTKPELCAIEQKDYFDIAIYAFNILKKMEERGQVLSKSAIEDNATYTYLGIFFQSARLYIDSIDDPDKKMQTITSFSRQFYDYIVSTLSLSLYTHYTEISDGAIYVHSDYRDGVKLKFSDDFVSNISSLTSLVEILSPTIAALSPDGSGSVTDDSYSRIQREITRIKAFSIMIQNDDYKDYVKSPYKVDVKEKSILPLLDNKNTIVRFDTEVIEKEKNTKTLLTDPRIKELKKIWPNAEASSWIIEGEYLRVSKAEYTFSRDGDTMSFLVSALYKDDLLTDTIILYKDYTLEIVAPDGISPKSYYALMANMRYYLDRIDETLQGESVSGTIRIFPDKKRININQSVYPVDIP